MWGRRTGVRSLNAGRGQDGWHVRVWWSPALAKNPLVVPACMRWHSNDVSQMQHMQRGSLVAPVCQVPHTAKGYRAILSLARAADLAALQPAGSVSTKL